MTIKFLKKLLKKFKARKRKTKFLLKLIPARVIKSLLLQFLVLALFIGFNWIGFWAVGSTVAFFNDTETSSENGFEAGYLDFDLSIHSFESLIALDETVSKNTVLVNGGGMDFQYTLSVEEVADEDGFCEALNLEAKLNGIEQYDDDLMSLTTSASTTIGTWKFNIELPVNETSFTNGEECQFDVVFKGWQTNVVSYGDGGFSDEERMSFTITAGKMVVLNEFLPRPDGIAYGFDFGNDSSDMPQGEWVELYNNSDQSIDLTGWYLRDATDGDGNKTSITALNTAPATTTIAGKGWLVVYMNKAIYNNTGDIVRLFDSGNVLIDSHTYNVSDFCEIEPSPGDENSTDVTGGNCPDVPPNKSYARIPDGIGDWVDPIPTPGGANVIEEVPLVSSAYVDASGSGAGTGNTEEVSTEEEVIVDTDEVVIEEGVVVEEVVTEEEIIVDSEEIVVEREETIVAEEVATEEEAVVVEEETAPEPTPEPESEPSPEATAGEVEPESNENI